MSRQVHRVIVSGVGAVSCFGIGAQNAWRNVLAARSGVIQNKDPVFKNVASKVYSKVPLKDQNLPDAADIVPIDLFKYVTKSELRNIGPACVFAMAATEEALHDANCLPKTDEERHRIGVSIGMCFIDMQVMSDVSLEADRVGHYNRVSPFFLPRIIMNMPAAHASIRFGLKAAEFSTTTSCSVGIHSIGDAFRLLRSGGCDIMVAGGVEASLNPLTIGGLSQMQVLSTKYNDRPTQASRPFDADRDGFVIGEGCGVMVLETLENFERRVQQALATGQKPPKAYAELLGYGFSADGYHTSIPNPTGDGIRRSMQAALKDAGVSPNQVSAVYCHATAAADGDAVELRAVADLMDAEDSREARTVLLNGTKGSTGHLIGASGAIESIFTALQCRDGLVAPCSNLKTLATDVEQVLDRFNKSHVTQLKIVGLGDSKPVPWAVQEGRRRVALKNSFGFGGTNATLCFASLP